ncbi:Xylulose kinase [Thalassocella blandensis]|nr:Xylulose kinase [Thalassocella blandensis]
MYLGVDCGTQGTKVIILDADSAAIVAQGYAPHSMDSDAQGKREQHPASWIEAFHRSFKMAIDESGVDSRAIKAMSVSGQQHGLVVLDKHQQVIRPAKLWCDTATAPQNEELLHYLGGEKGSLDKLGLVLATGYTASKLLWLKQHEPDNFDKIAHVLLPHDYLNFYLTQEIVTEFGDASGTGYFNSQSREWVEDVLHYIDGGKQHLLRALPPVIQADESVAKISPEVAASLNINPDVIVASGGGDNMMAAIGTGNIAEGIVTMSLGTSGAVYAYSAKPPVNLQPEIASFCSSSNGWLPLICTMNLTAAVNKVRDMFGFDLQQFNSAVMGSEIGAQGITMLPFLSGERVPALPQAQGQLSGLTMQNVNAANVCRAVMEGTTFGLRYGLDLLRQADIQSAQIRLIGGGANSEIWRQMVADITNTSVVCPANKEAGALGAAIQAMWCEQKFRGNPQSLATLCERYVDIDSAMSVAPDMASHEAYEAAYRQYRVQVENLQQLSSH